MNGIIRPAGAAALDEEIAGRGRWRARIHAYRWFIALVLLPTALAAAYYYLLASDQFESHADFVVRRPGMGADVGGSGVGQLLGFSLGVGESGSEAQIVEQYLLSENAVARLRREDGLVAKFRRRDVDVASRLWSENPTPEDLLKFYRKQVSVEFDPDTEISTLSVKAFQPGDAQELAQKLLAIGEEQVNAINQRTTHDQISAATNELAAAEQAMNAVQTNMTTFRHSGRDIDPAGTGKAQIELVSQLTLNLTTARAKLSAAAGVIDRNAPQYLALAAQVRSLEAQVAAQDSRLADSARTNDIASGLGTYEDLQVRRDFAAKRYLAAAASYQQALNEAHKQEFYLIQVVTPSLPVKSLFPERGRIVATIFFSLLIAYAIGWLMIAGVKEHEISV